ncbi:siderophore-interacting protein [Nocardioidaceae bacterium]|nr:siderophore-interacting protein [Nocardioidaceae bacterium]
MQAYVDTIDRITPDMVRLTLTGGDLADPSRFVMPEATDAYVNIALPPEGAPYAAPFEPAEVKQTCPRDLWPVRRRYTVRAWDPASCTLTLDFVVHGTGAAGRWASTARPGDVLVLEGPAGGYRPDPTADWHLLVGDESALPAIAASLEAVPEGALAVVRLLCDGPDHEVPLTSPGDLDVVWLHRSGGAEDADLLAEEVRNLPFPRGRVHAFVHGEADEIRALRRHLLLDRRVPRADMSCSPYWRRHMDDEAWRAVKGDFVAAMEAEVA